MLWWVCRFNICRRDLVRSYSTPSLPRKTASGGGDSEHKEIKATTKQQAASGGSGIKANQFYWHSDWDWVFLSQIFVDGSKTSGEQTFSVHCDCILNDELQFHIGKKEKNLLWVWNLIVVSGVSEKYGIVHLHEIQSHFSDVLVQFIFKKRHFTLCISYYLILSIGFQLKDSSAKFFQIKDQNKTPFTWPIRWKRKWNRTLKLFKVGDNFKVNEK